MTIKPKETEEILQTALSRWREVYSAVSDERELEADDIRFTSNLDNAQWDPAILQARQQDNPPRPCLTINKIPEKLDQVEGEFRQTTPGIKVRPVDDLADVVKAEIIGDLLREIQYNSDARSAYTTAFNGIITGGRGCWRINIEDSEDDPWIRDIKIRRIPNPLNVFFDPNATRADKSDARYCFVIDQIRKKDLPEEDQAGGEWEATLPDQQWHDWYTKETARIAEYWYKIKTKKTFYRVNRLGQMLVLPEDKLQPGDETISIKETEITQVRMVKLIANKIIEGPIEWPTPDIPVIEITGKEIWVDGRLTTRGMVRNAKTPQMMYNYWSSAHTEQIALQPKAPFLMTPTMLGPHKNLWDQSMVKNLPYLLYDPDMQIPGAMPQRNSPPLLSSAMTNEMARMEHDIMSSMGIYQASLGDAGQERSGRAIMARQRQGSIASSTYTDQFTIGLLYANQVIIRLIPYIYDTERIIRIRGEDDTQREVLINATPISDLRNRPTLDQNLMSQPKPNVSDYINDLTIGKYDVRVTIGPSYTTQRLEASDLLLQLINSVPAVGQVISDLVVKNLDIPGVDKIAERLKKTIPIEIRGLDPGERQPPPPPPDPSVVMEQMRVMIELKNSERKEFEAQIRAIKDLAEAEAKERGQQLAELTTIMQEIRQSIQPAQPQQGDSPGNAEPQ